MDAWAYPIVICFLGTLAMLLFKSEIKGLLNRAEKISPTGIETGKVVNQISESTEKTDVLSNLTSEEKKSDVDTAIQELDTPLVHEMEAEIEKSLSEWNIKPENKEKVILRLFAGLVIAHNYEQIYKIIFGSQLNLLELLNTNHGAMSPDIAISIYDSAKQAHPEIYKEYPFPNWLNYLLSQNLIISENDGKILLTTKGKDFLLFLVKAGYTKNKPF